MVGPAGGFLFVSAGPLQGVSLEVPPGALAAPTQIELVPVGVIPVEGFEVVSFAVDVRPSELELLIPATLSIPFQSGSTFLDPVILGRPPGGQVLEVGPVDVDSFAGVADVTIQRFQEYWAANRQFDGFELGDSFLPLSDGNTWTFTNDITATVRCSFTEPNLDGEFLNILEFTRGDESFGFYIVQDFPAGFFSLGEFFTDAMGSRQIIHDELRFVLSNVTIGQPAVETLSFQQFVPLGSTMPESQGGLIAESTYTRPEQPFFLPIGGFDNVARLSLQIEFTNESGDIDTMDFEIDMQRGYGLVRVRAFGVEGEVTSAEQFGFPIDPPLPPKTATVVSR